MAFKELRLKRHERAQIVVNTILPAEDEANVVLSVVGSHEAGHPTVEVAFSDGGITKWRPPRDPGIPRVRA